MINAFALEDARLVRLDEARGELNNAIWLDLLEPTSEEREVLQKGLDQSLASFLELEDIEASARFLKMKTVYICTHFSIAKMKKITPILPASHLPCVTDVCLPCAIANCRHSVCIVCVPEINV